MNIVVQSLLLSARALLDRKLWSMFILSAIINLIAWAALLKGVWWLIHDHPSIQVDWLRHVVEAASMALSIFIAFLLFPLTFPLIITLFEEYISIYIERKHYGSISNVSIMTVKEKVVAGIRFFGILLVLNLLLIPFYFIPVINVVLYYGINGYLLSREFFEMVVGRYESLVSVRRIRKKYWRQLTIGGIVLMFGAVVPVLNLLMPVLTVIFMVHFYHNIRSSVHSLKVH